MRLLGQVVRAACNNEKSWRYWHQNDRVFARIRAHSTKNPGSFNPYLEGTQTNTLQDLTGAFYFLPPDKDKKGGHRPTLVVGRASKVLIVMSGTMTDKVTPCARKVVEAAHALLHPMSLRHTRHSALTRLPSYVEAPNMMETVISIWRRTNLTFLRQCQLTGFLSAEWGNLPQE